jgi:hypothetical protein
MRNLSAMSVLPTRSSKTASSLLWLAALLGSPQVFAHGDHQHQPDADWHLDIQAGYQDRGSQVIPGYLPYSLHSSSAGIALQHLDISRAFELADKMGDGHVSGLAVLSQHSNGPELHEGWLAWQRQQQQWRLGQQLPDIGLLNASHPHQWQFADMALVNQALWGGQWSETGLRYRWQQDESRNLSWFSALSLLSASHMETTAASGAALLNMGLNHTSGNWRNRLKLDVYRATINKRGLQLFNSTSTHTHGSSATEYFSGLANAWALGWQSRWHTGYGKWNVDAEYQQRLDHGALSSASGQTTDVSSDLDLRGWGGYLTLGWELSGVELAIRWQTLGSKVELTNLVSDDLASSVLNANGQQPDVISYLAAFDLPLPGSQLKIQHNQASQETRLVSDWIVQLQQGMAF